MCPKPSFASIGIKQLLNGSYDNFGYHLNPKDCLHFKVADRFCEKCGVALCLDCGVHKYIGNGKPNRIVMHGQVICESCSDINWEKEQCLS